MESYFIKDGDNYLKACNSFVDAFNQIREAIDAVQVDINTRVSDYKVNMSWVKRDYVVAIYIYKNNETIKTFEIEKIDF